VGVQTLIGLSVSQRLTPLDLLCGRYGSYGSLPPLGGVLYAYATLVLLCTTTVRYWTIIATLATLVNPWNVHALTTADKNKSLPLKARPMQAVDFRRRQPRWRLGVRHSPK